MRKVIAGGRVAPGGGHLTKEPDGLHRPALGDRVPASAGTVRSKCVGRCDATEGDGTIGSLHYVAGAREEGMPLRLLNFV
jgi:hypothetical protein